MKRSILLLCLCSISIGLFSQSEKAEPEVIGKRSTQISLSPAGMIQPRLIASRPAWSVSLQGESKGIQHDVPNPEAYMAAKQAATDRKKAQTLRPELSGHLETQAFKLATHKGSDFQGNRYNYFYPPDNTIAISNSGYIVSMVNSAMEYYDANGNQLLSTSFSDYFSFLSPAPTAIMYDPKVLFDPVENKFIMVVLHGQTPSDTEMFVGFSVSDDPMDNWWIYRLPGDPVSSTRWFDFPNIGVSNADLYLTGNLFNNSDNFEEAMVYQIQKQPGFTGGNIGWTYWFDITTPTNAGCTPFTIVPLSYGIQGGYGPGIYLISNCSGGGNQVFLWEVTDSYGNNPVLQSTTISTTNYGVPGNAFQSGSNDELDTGDCRVQSGFFLDGIAHFVFSTDYDNLGYSRVRYNRLDVSGQSVSVSNFGLEGYDYCYPSIASLGVNTSDRAAVIGFLRSGTDMFPQARAYAYDDNQSNFSNSILVKAGDAYVDNTNESEERWGDYTGMARKFNSNPPTAWFAGCYGTNNDPNELNTYNTWISELFINGRTDIDSEIGTIQQSRVFPNPVQDLFVLEFDLIQKTDLNIFISDVQGRKIKTLYTGIGKSGKNRLTFNQLPLANGTYFLIIQDTQLNQIRNEKIVVQH